MKCIVEKLFGEYLVKQQYIYRSNHTHMHKGNVSMFNLCYFSRKVILFES